MNSAPALEAVSAAFNPMMPNMTNTPLELTPHPAYQGHLRGQFSGMYADAQGHVILHAPHAPSVEATVKDGHFSVPQPQSGFYWLILRTNTGLAQFGPLKID